MNANLNIVRFSELAERGLQNEWEVIWRLLLWTTEWGLLWMKGGWWFVPYRDQAYVPQF
jgi:hypothetical protein